jgi:hypothetical protein
MSRALRVAVVSMALASLAADAAAQHFGRNKVQYQRFEFRVLKTEHFDVHYYPDEAEAAADASRLAERWYARLSELLDHSLSGRQPLILYAAHPHFQQTNTTGGLCSSRCWQTAVTAPATAATRTLPQGGLIGSLKVPRLDLWAVVVEGDDESTLKVAVGHLPDTPLPWQDGNSALAGHRDTFFRGPQGLRIGDHLSLTGRR